MVQISVTQHQNSAHDGTAQDPLKILHTSGTLVAPLPDFYTIIPPAGKTKKDPPPKMIKTINRDSQEVMVAICKEQEWLKKVNLALLQKFEDTR